MLEKKFVKNQVDSANGANSKEIVINKNVALSHQAALDKNAQENYQHAVGKEKRNASHLHINVKLLDSERTSEEEDVAKLKKFVKIRNAKVELNGANSMVAPTNSKLSENVQ